MSSPVKLIALLDSAINYKKKAGKIPSQNMWNQLAVELEVFPETSIFEMQKLKNQLMFNPTPENYQKKEYERCDDCGSFVEADKPCYVCKMRAYSDKKK
jgi:hypothetical protein